MTSALLDYEGCAFPARGVGPGERVILWLRGCERACPGCMAPELWEGGDATTVERVVREILPLLGDADGLTISGGEPLRQAGAVSELIDELRSSLPELEVLLYTGYTLEESRGLGSEVEGLLARVDILIDGSYLEQAGDTLRWRGSDNQRVHLLTAAAQRWAAEAGEPWPVPRQLGVQMLGPNYVKIVGIPARGHLEGYRAALAKQGIRAGKEGLVRP